MTGQSQGVASQCSLKEIYFTPQNKTKQNKERWGWGLVYTGNVLTTVVYIFLV